MNILAKIVVMDDQNYVKADFKQFSGQEYYTANGWGKVAGIFKHIKQRKYARKCMVWQVFCTCGLKKHHFHWKTNRQLGNLSG